MSHLKISTRHRPTQNLRSMYIETIWYLEPWWVIKDILFHIVCIIEEYVKSTNFACWNRSLFEGFDVAIKVECSSTCTSGIIFHFLLRTRPLLPEIYIFLSFQHLLGHLIDWLNWRETRCLSGNLMCREFVNLSSSPINSLIQVLMRKICNHCIRVHFFLALVRHCYHHFVLIETEHQCYLD